MRHKDPLSFMVHRVQPCGFTVPGKLPVARLGPRGSLVAQHHEALHYHFNSLTTIGNAITLLCQLAYKCPTGLGKIAMDVASEWTNAIIYKLEGLINYVCFKRVKRRIPDFTAEEYEELLTETYCQAWHEFENLYDQLEIAESSKDALAMHVGGFVLNLPVYHLIEDLTELENTRNAVTREGIHRRYFEVESALCTDQGRVGINNWNAQMLRLWSQNLTSVALQKADSDVAVTMLRGLVPDFKSVPNTDVVQSVAISETWNKQLGKMGFDSKCRVHITECEYVDAMERLVIFPPAPSLSYLYPCNEPSVITTFLDDNPEFFGLVTLHSEKSKYTLSKKYGRIVGKGQVYLRCSFARSTEERNRYDIPDYHLFTTLQLEDLPEWLGSLQHPHIVITVSHAGKDLTESITAIGRFGPQQLWRFHWGDKVDWTLESIKQNEEKVTWVRIVLLDNSKSAFWLVKIQDRPCLDVYPVPWEFRDKLLSRFQSLRSDDYSFIDAKTIYVVLGLILNTGF